MSEIVSAPIATILWDVKKKTQQLICRVKRGKVPLTNLIL